MRQRVFLLNTQLKKEEGKNIADCKKKNSIHVLLLVC